MIPRSDTRLPLGVHFSAIKSGFLEQTDVSLTFLEMYQPLTI